MHFEWDPAKNKANIKKHGIDFADAEEMFNHPMMVLEDNDESHAEERWIGIGWIYAMISVVIYTERCGDVIRLISARKATRCEVKLYEHYIQN